MLSHLDGTPKDSEPGEASLKKKFIYLLIQAVTVDMIYLLQLSKRLKLAYSSCRLHVIVDTSLARATNDSVSSKTNLLAVMI